jgi:hypothetical protein
LKIYIVEMPDGAWSAFEVKLGEHQVEDAAAKADKKNLVNSH